jgi:hypothetical protein
MLKDAHAGQLVDAIRVVAGGEALLAPTVARRLLDRFAHELPAARGAAAALRARRPRAIAAHQPATEPAARCHALADRIVGDTARRTVHRSGRWQRSPATRDPRIGAALLLPAIRGAFPADDPRSLATLHAVSTELTEDGYCYRYRPDERPFG